MESKSPSRPFLPIAVIFIVVSLFSLAAGSRLTDWNIDPRVLLAGNGVLFLATAISFYLYNRALQNTNVQFFLRILYSSLLIKMVLCMGVTLLYLFLAGKAVSKSAILACFGLYIVYTFVEVKVLMRLSKLRKNA
jgi:hypothetical protein